MDDHGVLLLQTGGTIDKDYPKTRNQYAFEIGEPAVLRVLESMPYAPVAFKYRLVTVCKKDSQVSTESIEYTCTRTSLVYSTLLSLQYPSISIPVGPPNPRQCVWNGMQPSCDLFLCID